MIGTLTAPEAKAKFLAVLDEVEEGEEFEMTRHGRTMARISPLKSARSLENMFGGVAKSVADDKALYSTGEWDDDDHDPAGSDVVDLPKRA